MVSSSTVLTLLGFCASILFIVFVCSRLVCAIIRRVRRHRRRIPSPPLPRFVVTARYPSHLSVGLQGHVAGGGGLRPAAVAAFPTRVFSSAGSPLGEAADDSAMCVVCLAEYEDNEVLRVLPYCGHDFHVACIDIWLKQHSTCPVCRVSLRNNPGSKHAMAPRPIDVIVIPGCSPEVSGSNPCHYLFGARGHSPRTSPEVLTDEPAQANQIQVEVSGSNPCHYLFGARGHSPRASPEVLTDEPAQANQIQVVCHPSGDRGNNLTPSEASSPGENNNQTLKLNIETPCAVGSP